MESEAFIKKDLRSERCKTCGHTKVCCKDKNLVGDVFVAGHPSVFNNEELYKKYEEQKEKWFLCDDYIPQQYIDSYKAVSQYIADNFCVDRDVPLPVAMREDGTTYVVK